MGVRKEENHTEYSTSTHFFQNMFGCMWYYVYLAGRNINPIIQCDHETTITYFLVVERIGNSCPNRFTDRTCGGKAIGRFPD